MRRRRRTLGAIWLALALLVVALAFFVGAHPPRGFDISITQELQEPRAVEAAMGTLLTAVSVPGDTPYAAVLLVAALLVAAALGGRRDAALIAWSLAADGVAVAIKLVVARARPTADLVEVFQQLTSPSFPSGHVVHYVVFFGAIAYLAYPRVADSRAPSRAVRVLIVLASLSLIALIGPSRIYLGVHWASDVTAGYVIGLLLLAPAILVHRVLRDRARG